MDLYVITRNIKCFGWEKGGEGNLGGEGLLFFGGGFLFSYHLEPGYRQVVFPAEMALHLDPRQQSGEYFRAGFPVKNAPSPLRSWGAIFECPQCPSSWKQLNREASRC